MDCRTLLVSAAAVLSLPFGPPPLRVPHRIKPQLTRAYAFLQSRHLRMIARLAALLLCWSVSVDAQRVCKRGISCGNTCIAANRTCRVGPARADTSLRRDTLTTPAPARSDSVAPAKALIAPPAPPPDTSRNAAPLAKAGQTKVWANTRSRVYHCPGSRYYGNSAAGEWMTEAAAIAANYRAAFNRRCGT
jgi:hypothetical protein